MFNWNIEKSLKLKEERNITFEEIVFYINNGNLIDIIDNPNQTKYGNQKSFFLNIKDYIYQVPFVENNLEIFLK